MTYVNKIGQRKRDALAVILAGALALGGCGGAEDTSGCPYKEFLVVDVFDSLANYQGIQSGWFAKIVKDKFNMELNIIAPNVSGGGDKLYEIRAAAGNLGDLVIYSGDSRKLKNLVTSGLLLDMSDMLEDKDIMRYQNAMTALNAPLAEDGIYMIPSEISLNPATASSEISDLNYGPYLRWDAYEELGYPQMETLEDLLPVLQKMQQLIPKGDTGNPTYGFSLFKDWDGNLMNNAKQPACLYGYDESGFVLVKADGSDYQNIIEEDSLYIRALRFLFKANRLGLVDPDSRTQNYDRVFQKYADGDILFSIWPWLGQSAYNTLSHKEEGKGFMLAPIEDMQIYSYGCNPEGNSRTVIGIGRNAKDPERLAEFINWLYSPEGIMINGARVSGGTAGPEGMTWEMTGKGPALTQFGVQALMNGEVQVPQEWGTGLFSEGISALNYLAVSQRDESPDGYPYAYGLWESVEDMQATALDKAWSGHMQAVTVMEYLEENDMVAVAPGCSYTAVPESSEISTLRSQCRSIIVEYSWEMIFAEEEAAFDSLLRRMQTKVKSLGYEKVYAVDLANAQGQSAARQMAVEKYAAQ